MSFLRLSIVLSVLTLCSIHGLCAGPATQPATQPAVVTSPEQTVKNFLSGLEELLATEEKRDRVRARKIKADLTGYVADAAINMAVARYSRSVANLPPEKIFALQQETITAWAAVINYYRGHLDYRHMQPLVSIPQAVERNTVQIILPTTGPAETHPVDIQVLCVKEKDQWEVSFVGLLPAKRVATPSVE